jgi:microcystin-dependent protein
VSVTAVERSGEGRSGPADDRPLSEQEYQLLQRLLSDPFSLPIQFKTWLVSYLESSDLNMPLSSVQGLTRMLGITGAGQGTLGLLPPGLVLPHAGKSAPQGALMCDGQVYAKASFPRLYDAIDPNLIIDANQFRVPDLQERIPVGRGTKAGLTQVGQNENMPLGQRGPMHQHSASASGGSHTHTFGREVVDLTPGGTSYNILGGMGTHDVATDAATPAISVTVGPGGTPTDTPAFFVLNFIIIA